MNCVVIIPARMAATRLPGKPLADICGMPMIVRVWRAAVAAGIGPVVVAAGDAEIATAMRSAGGTAVLTDPALPSGTDRVFAALQQFDAENAHDAVINLQGDLPLLDPDSLRAVKRVLAESGADIATLAARIDDAADFDNPSVVKPVVAWQSGKSYGRALYFSRGRVPSGVGDLYHHIGIYAFCREALARFVSLRPSALEKRENLEQLRALEDGMTIAVGMVDKPPLSVDTPADLEKVRAAARQQSGSR
ncbi:MAG TPA: 3-deoxy-manno-octulosonate cytidylyltransferase [Rhizomicrobium sp.]|nr:3-deoxy-manno-octulosonate cytidylyltransferase [Rhizomicrobium sp.]